MREVEKKSFKLKRNMRLIGKLMILMILFWGINACSAQDSFTIEGEVSGLADGTVMELTPGATHQEEKPVATATVSGGKFSFTWSVESPRLFYIGQQGAWGVMTVLVENGNRVKISGTVSYQGEGNQRQADFSSVEITGAPLNDEYLRKIAFKDDLNRLYEEYHERNAEISEQLTKARRANNQALLDSLSRTEAAAALSRDEAAFFRNVGEQTKNAVMSNKDSWWGPLMMLVNMNWFEEEQKEWYAAFPADVQQSYYGQIVYKELFPETLEGKPAPAFTVKGEDGASVTLEQLLDGKKYALVDFWASWCGPCRREIPNLKAAYEKFASKGLEIISISIDKDAAAWQKALEEEQLPWPNFLDDADIDNLYGVKTIPAIFLLDGKGTVIAVGLRGEALQAKLAELLP